MKHRILYIHHAGGIGGAPLSLLFLLQQLDRTRYEPIVVTLKPGPVVDLYRAEGIETDVAAHISDFSHTNLEWYGGGDLWRLPIKAARLLPSILATRSIVKKFEPDLVHLNSSTLLPSAIGSKLAGVPVVWHIREPISPGSTGLRRSFLRRGIDWAADRVVAISQHDAAQLIPGDHIRVVYNFVDFDMFDHRLSGAEVRAELGIPPDAPVAAMLGGVAEPKGTLTLIRALPHLIEQVPQARVIIAGPPPRPLDEGGLKGAAKRLLGVNAYQKQVQAAFDGLSKHVRRAVIFTGIRRDMPQVLAASDCLLFPSAVAHFARPIIEAAAMATPSVASNLGGPRELIVDGETGYLVPPHDPQQLAATTAHLLNDPDRARQMGEAAYQRATRLFDAKTNAEATVMVYEELL